MPKHNRKLNRVDSVKAQRIFRKLILTHQAVDQPEGILDFFYTDFSAASEGVFPHPTEISHLMDHLSKQGLINRIWRGVSGRPGRVDARNLFSIELPDIEVSIVEEEPVTVVGPIDYSSPFEAEQDNAEVTIAVVNDTIKEMITYMQESQLDMVNHLQTMIQQIAFGDPEVAKMAQEQLLDTTSDLDRANAQIKVLEEKLAAKPEVTINAHMIIRALHKIQDETERWIQTPGWQKSQKSDHYRKSIELQIKEIKKEVDALDVR